jgi:hypothetical protein
MGQQKRRSDPDPARAREKTHRDESEQVRAERRGNWADEAAQARTADDPRGRAPRDRAGVPSTGDELL